MTYRVRLRRADWEIEVESEEKSFVEEKLREFALATPSTTTDGRRAQLSPQPLTVGFDRPLSLVELKKRVNPDSGTENAVTVAYYLEKFKGQTEYSTGEIIEGLKEMRCNFKNYHDVVLKARGAGYIMEGTSKKMWRLTDSGEQWVESRLSSAPVALET